MTYSIGKKVRSGLAVFALATASAAALGQVPTVADLANNQAFIKIEKAHQSLGSGFHMHFISTTVGADGSLYAFYIKPDTSARSCSDSTQYATGVGLAVSTDGINFADRGLVLRAGGPGAWDCDFASFPGVWYENGTFYLAYEGKGNGSPGDIGLATSTDGLNFTKRGVILSHATTGWEQNNIGTPSLWRENGTWYLFYHGYGAKGVQIGVATGTTLTALTKYAGNPIVPTVAGTWQSGTAGHRSIRKVGSVYYMVYEGSEAPPYDTAKWASGIATSTDLFHWSLFSQNAILPQSNGFGNDGPEFVFAADGSYVYYRRSGNVTGRALIATETYGGYDRAWGMSSPSIGHVVGRLESDGGWSCNVLDPHDYVQYGPYSTTIPVGDNIATWKIMVDNNTADNLAVARLEVVDATTGGTVLTQRYLTRKQFKKAMQYEYFSLPFTLDAARANHAIELRVWTYGISYLKIMTVGVS